MRCSYISILSTESYLPGALVLHHSLMRTEPRHPFVLLVTPDLPSRAREVLARHGIVHRVLDRTIANPNAVQVGHRWYYNYSKLHIFNLTELDKLVFLDADMLVQANLDELFEQPHMSAVNAGGHLPEYADWIQFNSGLLVVEPSAELFADMMRSVGRIEGRTGGDQAFLHAYWSGWPQRADLHLDPRFNVFHTHLDRYHELFGYTIDEVKVLHYIGERKPWHPPKEPARSRRSRWVGEATTIAQRLLGRRPAVARGSLRQEAVQRWRSSYREVMGHSSGARAVLPGALGLGEHSVGRE